MSTYYIVGFAGNAIPVIGVGLITRAMGSMAADASFGAVIILFAVGALLAAARVRERPPAGATSPVPRDSANRRVRRQPAAPRSAGSA